jgi:uncharacterized membrane protein (DUF4010 family)
LPARRTVAVVTIDADLDLAFRLITALFIGIVIGLERGWRERNAASGSRTAGLRTYALCGLLGGILAAISGAMQSALPVSLGFAAFAITFGAFKLRESAHDDDFSVTGVIAAFVVFGLGAYAVIGERQIAAAAGVAVAALLATREALHGFLARLTWVEFRSALLILSMSVIILPFLPDNAIDPLGSINPRQIWLFAILTASISYVGYLALKIMPSDRGMALAAMAGALVSSTAVTLDLARRSHRGLSAEMLAGATCLGAAISALRALALVTVVAPSVFRSVAPPALCGTAVFAIAGVVLLRRASTEKTAEPAAAGNPFELLPVFGFAVIFAMVSFAAAWLSELLGPSGLLLATSAAAMADVDAAVLAAVHAPKMEWNGSVLTSAVLLAMAVNAAARTSYALAIGTWSFASRFVAVTSAAMTASWLIWLLMP